MNKKQLALLRFRQRLHLTSKWVPWEIALLCIISFGLILWVGPENHWQPMISNVCYSIIAGCIFYVLTIHIPYEKKRRRLYLFLNNNVSKITALVNEFFDITCRLCGNSKYHSGKLLLSEFEALIKNLPLEKPLLITETTKFQNWFEFLEWQTSLIEKHVTALLQIQDILSREVLEKISQIQSSLSILHLTIHITHENVDIDVLLMQLSSMPFCCEGLHRAFNKDFGAAYFNAGVKKSSVELNELKKRNVLYQRN